MLSWWLVSLFLIGIFLRPLHSHDNLSAHCEDQGRNSFLWTIQRSPPAYLFGTIHVPYNKVWQYIPENSKVAFNESDSAIFELDLTNPRTMKALADCQMLPEGESLSDILPSELLSRLEHHFHFIKSILPYWISEDQKKKGLNSDYIFNTIAGNWHKKRPVWIMLLVNALTKTEVQSREIPVLDLFLAQQAEKDGKMTGAVEKVEEQCVPLNQLNLSQVVFALNQILNKQEQMRAQARPLLSRETLVMHYTCGNLDSLIFNRDSTQVPALLSSPVAPSDVEQARLIEEYFQHELIDKRNARMAQRVSYLLNQYPHTSFFFAFGAGHFVGNQTVIDRLGQLGYNVIHTKPDQNITRLMRNTSKKRPKNIRERKRQERLNQIWEKLIIDRSRYLQRTSNPDLTDKQFQHKSNSAQQGTSSLMINLPVLVFLLGILNLVA
ncbi:metalloprotease TIKI1-like [Biomphalaria glabrata]|uniref:Metalloprotease TIKI homolog n=1 Tax=Biomphalaria glabrata TaxID=6526 RepID=A0A9W3AEG9_BIOGL|nr:metalloprotease TIKI1-like [Biomphalaria glabrata]